MSKEIEELRRLYPMDSEFNYLTINMKVISHYCTSPYAVLPQLTCHYVNKQGEIKEMVFTYDRAIAIKATHE
jgi:hypothetical protein